MCIVALQMFDNHILVHNSVIVIITHDTTRVLTPWTLLIQSMQSDKIYFSGTVRGMILPWSVKESIGVYIHVGL